SARYASPLSVTPEGAPSMTSRSSNLQKHFYTPLWIGGDYRGAFFYNPLTAYPNKTAFTQQIRIKLVYDFSTIGINGLQFFSFGRYRQGDDIYSSGARGGFNPVSDAGEALWFRLGSQYLEYNNRDQSFMINAGWMNPYDFVVQQPLSKMFQNVNVFSRKGIGGGMGAGAQQNWPNNPAYNGNQAAVIPFASGYQSWGGTLRVKPVKEVYAISGLYMAIPNEPGLFSQPYNPGQVAPYTSVPRSQLGRSNPNSKGTINNNALSFGGASANSVGNGTPNGNSYKNPNGLYSASELGWEPKFGKDELAGKYAIGMIWWGIQNQNFLPVKQVGTGANAQAVSGGAFNMGSFAWYVQYDQMLYRAKATETENSRLGMTSDATKRASLSRKGLYMFNLWTFSPQKYSVLDLYFHTGLVYQGLIPGRPDDRLGVVFACAWFSPEYATAEHQIYTISSAAAAAAGETVYPEVPERTWGGVLEFDYQIVLNKWMEVKPFVEYVMNPQQNGTLGNEVVIGSQITTRF
ncbi:MAG: carbohydrate porin, partial [Verrucomicrobiota bacterium]